MRHAEFEECLVHEKFVQELSKVFDAVSTPTFEFYDARSDQVDPDEVIEQAVHGDNEQRLSLIHI